METGARAPEDHAVLNRTAESPDCTPKTPLALYVPYTRTNTLRLKYLIAPSDKVVV